MAANDRILKRLLRQPAVSRLVSEQIQRLGGLIAVTSPDGDVLTGNPAAPTTPTQDISLDGTVLGQVRGKGGELLADILTTLVAQDFEKRALATESLERYRELTVLYEVPEKIIGSPDASAVASLICNEAARYLSCDSATVLLLNEETGRLEIVASVGPAFHSRAALDVEDDLLAAIIRSGIGEIVNDVRADPRTWTARNTLQSVVCSPLRSKLKVLGVVVAGDVSPRHFNAADLQILNAMAAQAGTAIEAVRLDRELTETNRKPADIIYGVDDRPPFGVSLVLGVQHLFIAMMSLAYPVLITLEAGGSRTEASSVVSMSLIAMAVATGLQAIRWGPVGSGFLAPHITSAIYLAPSLLAARLGGLGLVFGMTLLSGVCMLFLSQLLRRFRKFFPSEVSGVVVLMVGLSMVPVAFQRLVGMDQSAAPSDPAAWVVGLATLGAIITFTVIPLGRLRLYSTALGMGIGYLLAVSFGITDVDAIEAALDLPLVGVHRPPAAEISFSLAMVLPFLAAALASGIKDAGLVVTAQKLNDSRWKRPDTGSVSGGIVVSGLTNVVSGVIGGVGLGVSAGSVGLSVATGATSRMIATFVGVLLMALAFMPQATALVALMPSPVMGAGLLYVACHLVTSGAELITSRMLDVRRTYVIGLSLLGGVGAMALPEILPAGPTWARAILNSPLAVTTLLAVGLNLLMSAWISNRVTMVVEFGEATHDTITRFFDKQGAAWGARSDVVRRAAPAITEWCEDVMQLTAVGAVTVGLRFDEFRLTASVGATDGLGATGGVDSATSEALDKAAKRISRRYQCSVRPNGIRNTVFEFEH